jgi:DNA replication protein DnaC
MTVTTPPAPPLPDALDALLRRLRLPYVRRAAPEVIATAAAQRWEPAEVLRVLLAEEAAGRDQATIRMRRRASGLPAGKTFDAWDPQASPIPAATQQALRTLEWLGRAENLCICGPSGTGKSHLAEALGHLAIDHGKTVAWHTLESLAALLRRHRADDTVNRAIGRLIRADLIVIDLCRDRDYAEPVTCRKFKARANQSIPGARAGARVGIVTALRGRRGGRPGACSGRVRRSAV